MRDIELVIQAQNAISELIKRYEDDRLKSKHDQRRTLQLMIGKLESAQACLYKVYEFEE